MGQVARRGILKVEMPYCMANEADNMSVCQAFLEEYSQVLEFLVRERGWTLEETKCTALVGQIHYRKEEIRLKISLDVRDLDVSVYFADINRCAEGSQWGGTENPFTVPVELVSDSEWLDAIAREVPFSEPDLWRRALETGDLSLCREWFHISAQRLAVLLSRYEQVIYARARSRFLLFYLFINYFISQLMFIEKEWGFQHVLSTFQREFILVFSKDSLEIQFSFDVREISTSAYFYNSNKGNNKYQEGISLLTLARYVAPHLKGEIQKRISSLEKVRQRAKEQGNPEAVQQVLQRAAALYGLCLRTGGVDLITRARARLGLPAKTAEDR